MTSRDQLRACLHSLHPSDMEVLACRDRMLVLLTEPRAFYRDCFQGHFTGSALVISWDGKQVLLNHHRFLNRWLQFGGHCDGDENILSVAAREAEEESGIKGLQPVFQEPMDLDIHAIPENPRKGEPAHEHYDLRFLFRAPQDTAFQVSAESHDLGWFDFEEALLMNPEPGMQRLIQKGLHKNMLKKMLPEKVNPPNSP